LKRLRKKDRGKPREEAKGIRIEGQNVEALDEGMSFRSIKRLPEEDYREAARGKKTE
jgi:hypothetical protein